MSPLPRALLLALLVTLGCTPPANYGKSTYGTDGYSMKNVHAMPPSLMVARKISRPLFIVLDPAKVKDVWELQTNACDVSGPGCEHFKLTDVQEFVRRDLKQAMEGYFSHVQIVDSAASLPASDYVVADVKIDAIKLRSMVTGVLTHVFIQMTWSFGLRPSDAPEYAYSYGGTAESDDSYPTFEAGCAQMVEHAVPAMLQKWVEDGGFDAMVGSGKKASRDGAMGSAHS